MVVMVVVGSCSGGVMVVVGSCSSGDGGSRVL